MLLGMQVYCEGGEAAGGEEVTRLRTALARTARWLERQSADGGLTRTQSSVLGTVTRLGPLGIGELAQREGINPTMLSRIVSKLDDAGLLARTTDPDDRRAARVEVTAAGHALHVRVRSERSRLLAARLAALEPAHRASLLAALDALEALAGDPA